MVAYTHEESTILFEAEYIKYVHERNGGTNGAESVGQKGEMGKSILAVTYPGFKAFHMRSCVLKRT